MNTIRISVASTLWLAVCCSAMLASEGAVAQEDHTLIVKMDDAKYADWMARWDKNITNDARNRYCDKAMGEDIGWLMTPFMDGFYYGYMATKDPKWVAMFVDWADSLVRRAVKEPDGYLGWPRPEAAGTKVDDLDEFNADSMLGEAMALRPVVLMAGEILKTPALKEKYGVKAESYIKLSEKIYEKWDQRGGWREAKGGTIISVVLPYGIDGNTGNWTEGFAGRNAPGNGFSHPNNKANHVARWLLAMSDVTGKAVYKERAEKWFTLMKSRMKQKEGSTYEIWNYWQPAGPWDVKPDGSPKHWVGVHPNPGYYQIDVAAIVDAFEHGLVFSSEDIERLVATALAENRYWDALVPYNAAIQREFEAAMKPDSWGGLSAAAKYLMLQSQLRQDSRISATTQRAATLPRGPRQSGCQR